MKNILLVLMALIPSLAMAQNCNCEENFNWMRTTFEENDAGYPHIIEQKGIQAYTLHNQLFEDKLKQVTSDEACIKLLNNWFRFFRNEHIGITFIGEIKGSENIKNEIVENPKKRIDYSDWETIEQNTKDFKNYLDAKTTQDLEGIWEFDIYTIGIKKIKDEYVGFIINVKNKKSDWIPGQIKMKIVNHDSVVYYSGEFYTKEFSSYQLIDNSILTIGSTPRDHLNSMPGPISLLRSYPVVDEKYALGLKAVNHKSNYPYYKKLNETTTYLRIPTFMANYRRNIKRLVNKHKKELLSTPNLIIDIRNNGGGSDISYKSLSELVYTDTIYSHTVAYKSTELNNNGLKGYIVDDPTQLKMVSCVYGVNLKSFHNHKNKKNNLAYVERLEKNRGKYVWGSNVPVTKSSFEKTHNNLQNIGIIINDQVASSAEQFLLAAKQSDKVKVFGTTTAGALDISNVNFVQSPDKNFILINCISRSLRLPEIQIDDVGIKPDYFIDDEIPDYEWINYTNDILNY